MEELNGAAAALLAGPLPGTSHRARHACTEKPAHHNIHGQHHQPPACVRTAARPTSVAAPVSPRQRLTRSSITAALHRGVKVPQHPMGAPKLMLLGGPKADARPSVGLLGWQPWGMAWQEQERQLLGVPDAAGRSHRVPPHGRHRPPPKMWGVQWHRGLCRARGLLWEPLTRVQSRLRQPGAGAIPPAPAGLFHSHLYPGVGRDTASSTADGVDTLQGSKKQLRGGGGSPDLPGEPRGRRASAFPQGKHQRKPLSLKLLLLFHKGEEEEMGINAITKEHSFHSILLFFPKVEVC